MAGIRKHGSHRYVLDLPALAAGAASDTHSLLAYDAYAEGAATITGFQFPYDMTSEELFEANIALGATLTGVVTNFASIALQLYRAAAVVNDIRLVFSAAGY